MLCVPLPIRQDSRDPDFRLLMSLPVSMSAVAGDGRLGAEQPGSDDARGGTSTDLNMSD